MTLVGLVHLSTRRQETARQHHVLDPICVTVFEEKASARLAVKYRPGLKAALNYLRDGDMLVVQEVGRLGRNTLEGLIVLDYLFEHHVAVMVLEGAAAGEHTERNVILDIAHALAEDHRRRDVDRKPKDGPESVRMLGKVAGHPLVIDADKRAAILARLKKGDSVHVIARELHIPVKTVYDVPVQQAAAAAIALRPIPPEAIRSGATVAASIAEKRARRYRTCAQCGGDCAPELNWADDLGVRVMYVCPQHGVHSVIDPHEHRR